MFSYQKFISKPFWIGFFLVLFFSCEKEKQPEMYQLSEMSALMETMYQDHQAIKSKIEKGIPLGDFPENYLEIHTAQLTDPDVRTSEFEQFAKTFIATEKKLYQADSAQQKTIYKQAVNNCIQCHQNAACGGPVERIRKLELD